MGLVSRELGVEQRIERCATSRRSLLPVSQNSERVGNPISLCLEARFVPALLPSHFALHLLLILVLRWCF